VSVYWSLALTTCTRVPVQLRACTYVYNLSAALYMLVIVRACRLLNHAITVVCPQLPERPIFRDQAKEPYSCRRRILSLKAIIWRQGSSRYRYVLTAGVRPADDGFNGRVGTPVYGAKPCLSRLSRSRTNSASPLSAAPRRRICSLPSTV